MSLNDFEFGKELGKGTFGSVSIVKRKEDQQTYAMKRVKIVKLSKKEIENSFNEVRILASLNHKNIIGYKEAFYDEKSSTLNIVMEYADDGDLSTKIKLLLKNKLQFEESTIWSILIQILEGLNYLHKSHVIHRDLKSANIFLTKKGIIKIGDLNVSTIVKRGLNVTQTGTPYYAAPEIWSDQPYDYKCDIWSVGCIIYQMATLHVPFKGTSMQQLFKNIMKGVYNPIPNRYSNDLKEIIKIILCMNPAKRPSAYDLLNNDIIVKKIKEVGLNSEEKEKAFLLKTIRIPKNISQVNKNLPEKQYSKIDMMEEMLENDEYETAKRTFYKIDENENYSKSMKNKLNVQNQIENIKHTKNKTLDEKQMIEKFLNDHNSAIDIINKNLDMINNLNNKPQNEGEVIQGTVFNSTIPEVIQGTTIQQINDIKKDNNKKEEKINPPVEEYENKFSNINYGLDLDVNNGNINNNINKQEEKTETKNSLDNLIIVQNPNNFISPNSNLININNNQINPNLDILNTEKNNNNSSKKKPFSDTKSGFYININKNINNIRREKNIDGIKIKNLVSQRQLITETLPQIRRNSGKSGKLNTSSKKNSRPKSTSKFEKVINKNSKEKNPIFKNINRQIKNRNLNNVPFDSRNKKEIKKELDILREKNNSPENHDKIKIKRPISVNPLVVPKLKPISARVKNNLNKQENEFALNKYKDTKKDIPPEINTQQKPKYVKIPRITAYKQFYNEVYKNWKNNKTSENDKNDNCVDKNKINEKRVISSPFRVNKNDDEKNSNKRKIIYEKIVIDKIGKQNRYTKGDVKIRYVGLGNNYNQYNRDIIKNPKMLEMNKDYAIQNLFSSNGNKTHKEGPRIILPKNMLD